MSLSPATIFPHAFATEQDDVPSPMTAMVYRRRARQLRGRLRKDPAALHWSLKQLAKETDAASLRTGKVDHRVAPARRVASRELVPDQGAPTTSRQAEVKFENHAAVANPTFAAGTIAAGMNVLTEAIEGFSGRVREMLAEGVLRYDQRKELMRDASRIGLGTFEATLIIAAVEHRYRTAHPIAPPARSSSVGMLVAALLLIEAVLLSLWIGFCC